MLGVRVCVRGHGFCYAHTRTRARTTRPSWQVAVSWSLDYEGRANRLPVADITSYQVPTLALTLNLKLALAITARQSHPVALSPKLALALTLICRRHNLLPGLNAKPKPSPHKPYPSS